MYDLFCSLFHFPPALCIAMLLTSKRNRMSMLIIYRYVWCISSTFPPKGKNIYFLFVKFWMGQNISFLKLTAGKSITTDDTKECYATTTDKQNHVGFFSVPMILTWYNISDKKQQFFPLQIMNELRKPYVTMQIAIMTAIVMFINHISHQRKKHVAKSLSQRKLVDFYNRQ